jgi:hypothetical protein
MLRSFLGDVDAGRYIEPSDLTLRGVPPAGSTAGG